MYINKMDDMHLNMSSIFVKKKSKIFLNTRKLKQRKTKIILKKSNTILKKRQMKQKDKG